MVSAQQNPQAVKRSGGLAQNIDIPFAVGILIAVILIYVCERRQKKSRSSTNTAKQVTTATLSYRARDGLAPADFYSQQRLRKTKWDVHTVPVFDARSLTPPPNLHTHGFVLVDHHSAVVDWLHPEEVASVYYDELIEVCKEQYPEASHCFLQSGRHGSHFAGKRHTIREENPNAATQGWDTAGTPGADAGVAMFVHNDMAANLKQATIDAFRADKLKNLLVPAMKAAGLTVEELEASRFVLLNSWRNAGAEPIQRFPLTVCDQRSVANGDVLGGRLGAYANPRHEWFMYPEQTLDELLLFKGFDSDQHPQFVPTMHTSFDDPNSPAGAKPRRSCDARLLLLIPPSVVTASS
jgi:hypothetical protein